MLLLRDVVLSRHSEQALSALTLYNYEGFFNPFWIRLASTLGSKAERRQNEGRVEALCVPTINSIIPRKPQIGMPLLGKKCFLLFLLNEHHKNDFLNVVKREKTSNI